MTSVRENVLAGLHARLSTLAPAVRVLRNAALPEKVPAGGLVILRDGDPGAPEVTLSPAAWHWQHPAEVEIFASHGAPQELDGLAQTIGLLLAGDRTLGGRCDWMEAGALTPVVLPVDGAAPFSAATLTITLHYSSPDPLA